MKLVKLVPTIPEIENMNLIKAMEINSDYILIVGGESLNTFGRNSEFIDKISNSFSRKTWIIEKESSDRNLLEGLFHPERIATVNVLWLPDGSKLTKVTILGKKTKETSNKTDQIRNIVKEIKGIDLIIEFEQS